MPQEKFGKVLRHIHVMADSVAQKERTDRQCLESFQIKSDEASFSTLLSRHGPMVFRVCRRVLQHEHDAEDAFQAVFLILARNPTSIRKGDALADWLYGVAYRTSLKLKRTEARKRARENRLRTMRPPLSPSPSWDDVQCVLDEEIQRLPTAFRAAFVLCVLDGKTGPRAAGELGIAEGTVSSRVARAKQLLRMRLSRRGIELGTLLAALAVAESAGSAMSVTKLSGPTLLAIANGDVGALSPRVASLAAAMTRASAVAKLKLVSALLVSAGLVVGLVQQVIGKPGVSTRFSETVVPEPVMQSRPAEPVAKARNYDDAASVTFSGRVLGPGGKPVCGAKLYITLARGTNHPMPSSKFATSGADGSFSFKVPRSEFADRAATVAATAADLGVGWVNVGANGPKHDLTIRLADDDRPIIGRIVDLQGKPIMGATVRLMQIYAAKGENLEPWLEACRKKKGLTFQLENEYFPRFTIAVPLEVRTDADGVFKLTGIGSNRLIRVQLDGETIVSQQLSILTSPVKAFELLERAGNPEYHEPATLKTYYGARFLHIAAPCKPIVGTVRDSITRKPLTDISVQSYVLTVSQGLHSSFDFVRTRTDANGRFRLTGMPKREGNQIVAVPDQDLPYLPIYASVPESPGLDAVEVDIELKTGVWIQGRMTDKATGKSIKGIVEYFASAKNPNLRDHPGYDGVVMMGSRQTGEDGSYRLLGLPGPGFVVGYRQTGKQSYLDALERDDEFGIKQPPPSTAPYQLLPLSNYGAFARIDPAADSTKAACDLTLDPGWTFSGTVIGLDHKPVAGTTAYGPIEQTPAGAAEFVVHAYNPAHPPNLYFLNPDLGWFGQPASPQKRGDQVLAQMKPGATLTGRLVDNDGKPRPDVGLELSYRPRDRWPFSPYGAGRVFTDKDGRFKLTTLVPGFQFQISDVTSDLALGKAPSSGDVKDLGDVRMKVRE